MIQCKSLVIRVKVWRERIILGKDIFSITGMAGSSPARRRKSRRRIYTALLLTVIIVIGVYFLYFAPGPPIVVDFSFQMSIQISIQAPNGTKVSFLGQDTPVGVAGYPWHNHTYDGQGAIINNVAHYPVYSEQNPDPYPGYTVIHVASTVNRLYFLSDYFSVWGKPLGQNNTAGIPAQGSSYWQMCTGKPPNQQLGHWGQEVLTSTLRVTIVYFNSTKGPGCL